MAMRVLSIFFVMSYLAISSCEEVVDFPVDSVNTDLLVVEGMVTNERTSHLVRLTHPYLQQNGEPVPATGATMIISDDAGAVLLHEFPLGSGLYYTPVVRAVSGTTYTLHIYYNGKEYQASDSASPVEPLDALQYEKVPGGYSLKFQQGGQDSYYIDHYVSWKNTTACDNSGCEGRLVFYDIKSVDVNEIFKPKKEAFVMPENSIVIRKKYSVSPAYKAFLRSMLSETEWRGGVFDVQRDNVHSNLSEGAIGFFAVSTILSDTTTVN
jgi:hypothetical protein